jgi:hypothetical protein
MTVAGTAFEMRVVLEIVHRQLAVSFEEADRDRTPAQHPLDADGYLGFVGTLNQAASPSASITAAL